MRNFKDNKFSKKSAGRPFNKSSRFGRDEVEMHKAICDKCGNPCKVPFKPSNNKPVYCSSCFQKGETDSYNPRKSFSPKSTEVSRKDFEELNSKLDHILEILEGEQL
ncbi:MAG: hypothetical protein UR28_C0003G0006 [Candidatus Peregrinibacteria bacterium GW2011_GWF2_33_10]|nr:MAG: hypothetical protein UR28_C0003G0006 [Candidatus Peregrinibacteria bacterium GW2011_GWF2_33_10]OGJ44032.1 MAG: hypothetical protein A2272_01290 [Candidatus Peregrinibacteria bacterium RIFOXYA12_FULL_33_12]OGJ44162.1 MAG: hypothetical protein A2263_04260 [Candidatus Peregrinibacteria bacterium RIFOXYA2_FULL_33_21]OGJ51791.1 MAG: hypothetical protein A2307_04925 [Candidatus Peregrinibacteria bacterium RIFOXYB2_FULL_33_20]